MPALALFAALLVANLARVGAQDCGLIPGCSSCVFRRVGTTTRMLCAVCGAGYVVAPDQRSCLCAPGYAWNETATACELCGAGSWCPGGGSAASRGPRVPCGVDMTTTSNRARYDSQCVPVPGTGLLSDGANAQACAVGFYSYGLTRRPCQRCPGTFTTSGAGANSKWQCGCPPGFRYRGETAIPCGFGFYKSGVDFSTACTRCPTGLTTPTVTAGAASDCRLARPGYRLTKDGDGAVTGAAACGSGSYGAGGDVTACTACPAGTSTATATADVPSLCLPTPGYGYDSATGEAVICPIGTFKEILGRATCASCGAGLLTAAEGATSYASNCYIPEGWGATIASYNPITLKATKCMSSQYGVASRVYGPSSNEYACQKCPLYATTPDTNPALAPADAAAVVNNGSASCVPVPGYGWDGAAPARCTGGKFSAGYARTACTACPAGMTTPDANPALTLAQQAAVLNTAQTACVTLPGYGFVSSSQPAVQCAEGTWAAGYTQDACTACPEGTTSPAGSTAATACVAP